MIWKRLPPKNVIDGKRDEYTDGKPRRAVSDYGYSNLCCHFTLGWSHDHILLPLRSLHNIHKTINQIWQMLIHRPGPASSLHVAAYDLTMDNQHKVYVNGLLERTKIEKL